MVTRLRFVALTTVVALANLRDGQTRRIWRASVNARRRERHSYTSDIPDERTIGGRATVDRTGSRRTHSRRMWRLGVTRSCISRRDIWAAFHGVGDRDGHAAVL